MNASQAQETIDAARLTCADIRRLIETLRSQLHDIARAGAGGQEECMDTISDLRGMNAYLNDTAASLTRIEQIVQQTAAMA